MAGALGEISLVLSCNLGKLQATGIDFALQVHFLEDILAFWQGISVAQLLFNHVFDNFVSSFIYPRSLL